MECIEQNTRPISTITNVFIGNCVLKSRTQSLLPLTATPDVIQCDFVTVDFSSELNIVNGDNPPSQTRKVDALPKSHFHVVVFCLLLEYLPDPRLRLRAVHNAYKALKDNG